jgi:hypothetical protein
MSDQATATRHFLRCRGCLSIMAIAADRPPAAMRCSACEGGIEVMGQVRIQRILRLEDHTACDLRCTMASGPSCDCQCGGKNHGSGIMVTAAHDVGGIPRVNPPNPEKARRTHSEWLQAAQATRARIAKHFPQAERARAGERLAGWDSNQAERGARFLDQVLAAGVLKTHHGRLHALAKINDEITKGAR